MNDFTKEELEDIREYIGDAYRSNPTHPRIYLTLASKIQWMIDNYCEHKKIEEEMLQSVQPQWPC